MGKAGFRITSLNVSKGGMDYPMSCGKTGIKALVAKAVERHREAHLYEGRV
jgi:hypothetical protein